MTLSVDKTQILTYPAYTDSIDETDLYSFGICGEKEVSLRSGSPPYLTLVAGADPIFDDFVINYDETLATSYGTVSVDIVVSFKDYPDNV